MSEPVVGYIKNIEEWAVHDGPGLRCVVFFKGCPLTCKFCQNPELIDSEPQPWFMKNFCKECGACVDLCPAHAIGMDKDHKIDAEKCTSCFQCIGSCPHKAFQRIGRKTTSEEVHLFLMKLEQFYAGGGGVTLSGGEPLFQPDFAADILRRCRASGLNTTIETCLFANYNTIKKVIIDQCDGLLCDLKHMDSAKHEAETGVPNELILENFKTLEREYDGEICVRIPLIPGFNDDRENIRASAEFLSGLQKVVAVDLLPFNTLPIAKYHAINMEWAHKDAKQQSEEYLEELKAILDSYGARFRVTIGGLW
jgi:pyruvate formate lyase activating enzyme